ncbi:MAG: ParB/RepB/Spo0J family partition protein [candidate division KSB1 bacterium]|nr:ParB/RepB/Spo0J family partition protein [candidate division KSB1 bacterium]MDZ7275752.1 ParB/RepB/Spo0J family partition protein [candidate division KSB1 bacterium]MDZ7284557.1 ParB/RepB/Spo0J family partition protein [candidate division KSB1 bacterium]MDZ7298024.1 ParB/RepB/Spo0J family partition protein [candidate division KSB1 bacterium]MDZ7307739.1 ParB/RepB/Spo0J family partition protein [candidate division KSB1 bacterium]
MATNRLGRGLQALIPELSNSDSGKSESVREIEIARITANPFQPRVEFDPARLEELKQSILQNGLITPVTVRPLGANYQLIAGERRLRAVQELGYTHIPAFVLDIKDDRQLLELAIVENVQREDLNPIEEARGYQRLIEECHLTQEVVAQKVGKDRVTIANALRLLKLAEPIQESLKKGELTAGHARALLTVTDKQKQLALWKKTVKQQLSVRQVEKLARTASNGAAQIAGRKLRSVAADVQQAEDMLRRKLGTQVRIEKKGKGGVIEIEFYSADDLERLLELLQNI